MPRDSEITTGELDKNGFKEIQITSAMGPPDRKGQIVSDGYKIIADDGHIARVTLIRR